VQAACGRLHSLFVNDLGMVFACGQAMHGALGISDASPVPLSTRDLITTPTLVEFFLEKFLVVTQVACGGDELTGAHSAAVTNSGELFTWGSGVALGSRSLRNSFKPQRIHIPVDNHGDGDEDGSIDEVKIQSVACGCGFAVAIAKDYGAAFVWGKWSEGRLGLGRIPVIERASRRHGGRKQLQAFQLSPRRLTLPVQSDGSNPVTSKGDSKPPAFVKIACGDAHCVAITMDGRLVSWGRGGSGQLGIGALGDSLSPVPVAVEGDRWRDVSAGSDWSMALDYDGRVWSWGGCGSGALGLSVVDSTRRRLATQALLERHEELVNRQRHREAEGANVGRFKQPKTSGSDLMPRLSWMIPHRIPAFAGGDVAIISISAGVSHGAALSQSGAVFVWGDDGDSNKLDGSVDASSPHVVDLGGHNTDTPSVTEVVECGGRQVVVLVSSGGSLARDLGSLFQCCMRMSEQGESKAVDDDWAGPDVALLVSGRRLLAHKVLLARRSPALHRLMLDQLAAFNASSTSSISSRVPEVLVPSLRLDVARVVLEYIYTDAVSLPCQLLSMLQEQQVRRSSANVAIYLAKDVLRAATELELPGLARICRERLAPALSSTPVPQSIRDGDNEEALTLSESLRAAYGESTWSDVTLVAEGREFPAHRCVLMARSEFFRQQLRRDRQHSGVVVVEDSSERFKRVLDFIYSDQVGAPPSNITDVDRSEDDRELQHALEDLAAAHRYGLERLKRACERRVRVTTGNCWAVLAAAELSKASQLKLAALAFAQRHLPHVVFGSGLDGGDGGFERFQQAHPGVVAELFTRLQATEREDRLMTVRLPLSCCGPYSMLTGRALWQDWKISVEQRAQEEQQEEVRARQERQAEARFPWLSLTLAVTFGALFLALVQSPALHFHAAVPALNLLALALLAAAVILGWLERI
jgi:alpha-tubulin suppressor-like RCC1 family protein